MCPRSPRTSSPQSIDKRDQQHRRPGPLEASFWSTHPSGSLYHFGIHCMSCSEETAKIMQLVVTASTVVISMIFCQLPIPFVRFGAGRLIKNSNLKVSALISTNVVNRLQRGHGQWTRRRHRKTFDQLISKATDRSCPTKQPPLSDSDQVERKRASSSHDRGRFDYHHHNENHHLIVEAEGKADAKSVVYPYWMTICR